MLSRSGVRVRIHIVEREPVSVNTRGRVNLHCTSICTHTCECIVWARVFPCLHTHARLDPDMAYGQYPSVHISEHVCAHECSLLHLNEQECT